MKENEKKVYNEAEINQHASFFDAEIIPHVFYQVYGFDKVYCHDDEGMDYEFNSTNKSNIQIQVVTEVTKTYYKVGELDLGDETSGAEAAPEGAIMVDDYPAKADLVDLGAKVGDIYCKEVSGTPNTYSYKVVTASLTSTTAEADLMATQGEITSTSAAPTGSVEGNVFYYITETLTPVSPANSTPYEYNKYGEIKPNSKIYVTFALNATLKSTYSTATINIDGKDYDLGLDGKTMAFYMNKDHRIQINWIYGELVETFRITCNR